MLPAGQLQGEVVRLVPLDVSDLDLCHGLVLLGAGHWPRLHGAPDVQTALSRLWSDALAAFRVVDNDGDRVAVASIHSSCDRHGYASFEVIGVPGTDELALEEAAALVVDYGFAVFNFRKLYHVHFGHQPGRLKDRATEEARLTDSVVIDGHCWDRVTDAVYRPGLSSEAGGGRVGEPGRTRSTSGRGTVRTSRSLGLRDIRPADSERLRAIELSPANLVRWRYGGQIPPPTVLDQMRNDGVLYQQVITVGDEVMGLVNLHSANLRAGTAWLAIVTADEYHHSGLGMKAAALFIDRMFDALALRKLYAEVNEANLADFGSMVRRGYATTEGVLRGHAVYGGEPFDVHLLCLDRDVWIDRVRPRLRRWQ